MTSPHADRTAAGPPPLAARRRRIDFLGFASRMAAACTGAATAGLLGFLAWKLVQGSWRGAASGPLSGGGGWDAIASAAAGTFWLLATTGALAAPVGIGTALYLQEYARPKARAASLLQAALTNLCGVPSVVFGVAALALLVHGLSMDRSILVGGLALAAAALPPVVSASAAAIGAVPDDLRTAAYGLGATRWQVVRRQVLPAAAPGIATGACAALARATGEAAPLVVVGAASFATFAPAGPAAPLVSLPTQVFSWAARPQAEFATHAAGAALALLAIVLGINLAGLLLRRRLGKALP